MIPESILTIFEIIMLFAIAICAIRMAIGPTAADRMVAVDLLALLVAFLLIGHAIRHRDEALLDVVLVFSVLAFFGTVSLARYLQRGTKPPKR